MTTTAHPESSAFVTTQWTRVLSARGDSPEARAALSDLCAAYYRPVLEFIRRTGRDEDTARDFAQEFFARLLEKPAFGAADPNRGRFRSYLLGAVKHFLADEFDRTNAAKRGGGSQIVSLNAVADNSTEFQIAAPVSDTLFDRQWALTVVDRAVDALANEFNKAGKQTQFEALKPWLVGDPATQSQSDTAKRLGLSENALKVAIHRMRRRFRELVKSEISETLVEKNDVQEELRYLVDVLAS